MEWNLSGRRQYCFFCVCVLLLLFAMYYGADDWMRKLKEREMDTELSRESKKSEKI